MQSIIQDYVKNYTKAIHRMEKVYSINIDGPNQRYEFDLTYLNEDLQTAYEIKYILSVIDVI